MQKVHKFGFGCNKYVILTLSKDTFTHIFIQYIRLDKAKWQVTTKDIFTTTFVKPSIYVTLNS